MKLTKKIAIALAALLLAWQTSLARDYSIEGRVLHNEDGSITMGYPGITLQANVKAKSAQLDYEAHSDGIYIDVSIDEAPFQRIKLSQGRQRLTLYEKEDAENTSIQIVKRTESWQGLLTVHGMTAESGEFLDPPALPDRKLLFIGDSITCGAGTEAHSGGTIESNGRLAFGYQLARRLEAQANLVSYGGKGLVRDWQGMRSEVTAPQFYERILPDDATTQWDHTSWQPDAIAVCLGTNDFNQGLTDQQDWVAAYVSFLRTLRRDAPEAPIFVLESPMFGDAPANLKRSALRLYLQETIAELGDSNVHHVKIAHYPGRPENSHPTAKEHTEIANELEPLYRQQLGW